MKRRSIFASLAGLLSSTLPKVAPAATMPDLRNRQYHIEITFNTLLPVTVDLMTGAGSKILTIASKPATSNKSHKLHFINFKNTDEFIKSGTLRVATVRKDGVKAYGVASNTGKELQFCTRTIHATGMNFAFTDGVNHACIISFYLLPVAEETTLVNYGSGIVCKVVAPTTKIDNLHSQSIEQLKMHTSSVDAGDYHARIVPHNLGFDTLVLPSISYTGHYALCPTLMAASADEKPHIKRRLLRHADNLRRGLVAKYGDPKAVTFKNQVAEAELHKVVANEVMHAVGGSHLVKNIKAIYNKTSTMLANAESTGITQTIAEVKTAYETAIPDLAESTRRAQTNQSFLNATTHNKNKKLFGLNGIVALQLIIQGKLRAYGYFLKAGLRVSLTLARGSFYNLSDVTASSKADELPDNNAQIGGSSYSVLDASKSGYKYYFCGIIGIFDSGNYTDNWLNQNILSDTTGCTIDVEITFGCTTLTNGKTRWDYIQVDPVLDFSDQAFIGKIVSAIVNGATDYGNLQLPNATTPTRSDIFISGVLPSGQRLINRLTNWLRSTNPSDIAEILPGDGEALPETVVEAVQEKLKIGLATYKSSTLEWSLLRFVWMSNSILNQATVFHPGINLVPLEGAQWVPGLKYITGEGLKLEVSTPDATVLGRGGKIIPRASVSATFRLVSILDVYYTKGSKNWAKFMGFYIS
jgi:hypothetical protein